MIEEDLAKLEQRVHRLISAHRQAANELRRITAERDRLLAANSELRERIETIISRIRALELEQTDG